jgi:hypothetical protein
MEQKENNNLPFSIIDFIDLTRPIPFKQSNILFHDENGMLTSPPETYECEHPSHADICKTNKENKYNIEEMFVQQWGYRTEIKYDIFISNGLIIPRPKIICKDCYEYEMRKKHE